MTRLMYLFLLALLGIQLLGCASTPGETLRIDARNVQAMQHVPDELTAMLADLDYQWVHVEDPESHRGVKVVQSGDEYRMRFEHVKNRQVRIDARIRRQDGFTWLHFYQIDSQALSPSSVELFEKLEIRARQEFGAVNVSR